jgi:hypothetical protein
VFLPTTKRITFNPRPKSMAGLKIAFVDNTKPNFNIFCERVAELLLSDYGVAEAKIFRKHGRTGGASPQIMNEVKAKYDFAITGLGD